MSGELIVGVAGIRGIIGDSLTPETALPFLRAFAASLNGDNVVIGCDTRPSRYWLHCLAVSALTSSGKNVHDLGICPTPTVGMFVRKLKCAGGIVITASHNPIEYNGLKFMNNLGQFYTPEQNQILQKIRSVSAWMTKGALDCGKYHKVEGVLEYHVDQVIKALGSSAKGDGSKKLKVVVDCCNGASSKIAPMLLKELNCEAVILFDDQDQPFPREAEPLPEHLGKLCAAVKKHKADLGFAIDPDADRLAIVDEKGVPLGEERTLVLSADAYYRQAKGKAKKGAFVVNLSTSLANDKVGEKYGVEVKRTPIGEAHVVNEIVNSKAPIGGEGNGGVIFPEVHSGRDAATAMAWILTALRNFNGTISELNKTIPIYQMAKNKIPLDHLTLRDAMLAVRREFRDAKSVDEQDGLKFNFENSWFHIRASNTEPIIRATAEALKMKEAEALLQRATEAIS